MFKCNKQKQVIGQSYIFVNISWAGLGWAGLGLSLNWAGSEKGSMKFPSSPPQLSPLFKTLLRSARCYFSHFVHFKDLFLTCYVLMPPDIIL
ncbi:hypothetical protein F8388_027070 [Cannabis sativa]|uniref:Uncharacterized protein n=1 Tax=Cannabis sativa TaxID=3483 RepID=A0A7J6FP34_CANSA|nr:hypothetical protein F8388_027070 [Cannabis sativa]KAF4387812.1 hypothetical protein G4B88_004139 [Cannabis sativa]